MLLHQANALRSLDESLQRSSFSHCALLRTPSSVKSAAHVRRFQSAGDLSDNSTETAYLLQCGAEALSLIG